MYRLKSLLSFSYSKNYYEMLMIIPRCYRQSRDRLTAENRTSRKDRWPSQPIISDISDKSDISDIFYLSIIIVLFHLSFILDLLDLFLLFDISVIFLYVLIIYKSNKDSAENLQSFVNTYDYTCLTSCLSLLTCCRFSMIQ